MRIRSPLLLWGVGAVALVGLLALLRARPWRGPDPEARSQQATRESLAVGFLPVT
jgi:hypothetical protein